MKVKKWLLGLAPVVVLSLTAVAVMRGGVIDFLHSGAPPVEEISFGAVTLSPGVIEADLLNGGPDPVTVAQVMIDEAYWTFTIEPGNTIGRLRRARVTIPFPWVQDEPHEIVLVTSTGLTFDHSIDVATATPRPDGRFFGVFTAIGLYVGVIPVAIGLLWLPLLRDASDRTTQFALALTAGLLVFLGADALIEAFEASEEIAGGLQGDMALIIVLVGTVLGLQALSSRRSGPDDASGSHTWRVSFLVALGVGLHNLGEGLAIGAAYALGEAALGASLVLGFMVHNTTEGLAIVAPVASESRPVKRLVALGVLAGAPTIAGALLGGLAYSPLMAMLFLAAGAGAIVQVVMVLLRMMASRTDAAIWSPLNATGLMAGLAIMYVTGLFAMG